MSAEILESSVYFSPSSDNAKIHRPIDGSWFLETGEQPEIVTQRLILSGLCLHAQNLPKEILSNISKNNPEEERQCTREELRQRLINTGFTSEIASAITGSCPDRYTLVTLLIGRTIYLGIVDQTNKTSSLKIPYKIFATYCPSKTT